MLIRVIAVLVAFTALPAPHAAIAAPFAAADLDAAPGAYDMSASDGPAVESTSERQSEPKRRWWQRSLWGWVLLVAHVLGAISAVNAIMSARTEPGALAWSVALVAAPVVSVPAYWVLGRNKFAGYVESREQDEEEFAAKVAEVAANMEPYVVQFDRPTPGFDALRDLVGMRLVGGNKTQLLIDGEETFDSILEGIAAAEEYVLVLFFIIHDDALGRRLGEAMMERAKAGVRVYLLYDELGSTFGRGYRRDLEAAGVTVAPFNTRQGLRNQFQVNFRNHRKIVVTDGSTAWIGGHNVGDEYLGEDPEMSPWRDTHLRIDGPLAIQAQGVFAMDWYWAKREILPLDWVPDPAPDGSNMMGTTVATGPADEHETASLFYVHALNSARERVWITAPYFVPDEAIVKAIKLAGLRGVDVRILVPGIVDKWLADRAMYYYMEQLDVPNVKFYMHRPGFLHQKVMVVDQALALIGTHNFDNRSFRLNFEVSSVIYDEAFTDEVAAMLERDMATSEILDPSTFKDRSWWWRFTVNFARLWAPVL